MSLETCIQILIIIHASFGGIALLSGLVAIIVKKGSKLHKQSGKVFFYSMLASALSALIIAIMPNHFSPFLCAVSVFSSYLILSGRFALKFKTAQTQADLKWSKWVSFTMLITAIFMIIVSALKLNTNGMFIVLLVFGLIGLLNAAQDIRSYRNIRKLNTKWLQHHIGKMTGGFIAAVTAFIVVNGWIPGIYGWLSPAVLGTIYIFYWIRKVTPKTRHTTHP